MTSHTLKHLRSQQGVTLLELLTVLVILGLLLAIAGPQMSRMTSQTRRTSLLNLVAADVNLARMSAVRRGGSGKLSVSGANEYVVTVARGSTARLDTLKQVRVTREYPGVTLNQVEIRFNSRGLLSEPAKVVASQKVGSATLKDSLIVTGIGQVHREY